jgi:hypothetical protein
VSLATFGSNRYGGDAGQAVRLRFFGAGAKTGGNQSVHLIARDRLRHLMAAAKEAVAAVDPQADNASMATFEAGIAASRAAGFLEAFTISHPDHADEMLTEFEALAGYFDEWMTGRLRNAPLPQA